MFFRVPRRNLDESAFSSVATWGVSLVGLSNWSFEGVGEIVKVGSKSELTGVALHSA